MANLSTSYDVESGVKTTLKTGITSTATTGLVLKRALTITSGVLLINRGATTQEWISFGSTTVNGSETTLGDVVRGLALTGSTFTGSSTRAYAHAASETVELVDYHVLLNLKANIDRANTWSADQLFNSTTKITFGSASNWIRFNGSNDIELKSTAQAAVTLSQLAAGAGVNDKVKVTSNDTTASYLDTKINPGLGLVRTVTSPSGNEGYTLDINLEASNPSLQVSSDELGVKIKASGGLAKDASGLYVVGSDVSGLSSIDMISSRTYGESITANTHPLVMFGDGLVYKAKANDLTLTWDFIGMAKSTGVLNDVKNVAMAGTPATIATLSGSAGSGKKYTGQSQLTSSTNVQVYGVNWYAQTFTPATGQSNVAEVILNMTSVGTPTSTYSVEIRATTAGVPSGAALGTATLAVASMASGDNTFIFASPVSVTPGTVYAIVVSCAAALVGNNYQWNYATTNPYSGGQWCSSIDSGASWAGNASNDFRFTIKYRGVASTDVFVTDSNTLDLTPGTYFKRIGRALSNTEMMMFESCPSIYATYSASLTSSTVDTTITLGFRPRFVICYASCTNGAIGFWHHGVSGGAGYVGDWDINTTNSYKTEGTSAIAKTNDSPASANHNTTITVQSSTSDTITIRRTTEASVTGTLNVYLAIFG